MELKTVDDIIEKLGGPTALAKLTGRKAQHVNNWRVAKRLPANTFLVLRKELEARELSAPAELWGITQP